jgi:hypothetical protein
MILVMLSVVIFVVSFRHRRQLQPEFDQRLSIVTHIDADVVAGVLADQNPVGLHLLDGMLPRCPVQST